MNTAEVPLEKKRGFCPVPHGETGLDDDQVRVVHPRIDETDVLVWLRRLASIDDCEEALGGSGGVENVEVWREAS